MGNARVVPHGFWKGHSYARAKLAEGLAYTLLALGEELAKPAGRSRMNWNYRLNCTACV